MSRYDEAVLDWAAHLRSGGTTPWSQYRSTTGETLAGDPPGAAQLELVRRLAGVWDGPGFERVADRVLYRDPPGRGLSRQPLAHPSFPGGGGAPAVDPSDLPVAELLRLGTGVLADLVAASAPPRIARVRGSRRRPLVLGAPISRHALARTARGFSRSEVLVCAPSLEELLTEVWSTRVQRGSASGWRSFVQQWAARGSLPASADPARLAAQAAQRVGPARVHVLVGRAARVAPVAGVPAPLTVQSAELLRRLNPVLGVRLPEAERERARAAAVHLLRGGVPAVLAVPQQHESWARERAAGIAEAIRAGGYAVHGDVAEFAAGVSAPRHPRAAEVLDRLLEVVVRTVREEQR